MNVKKWLTKSQWEDYENAIKPALRLRYKTLIESLKALAACRELMAERHWIWDHDMQKDKCVYCGMWKSVGCDCAWATALKGVGGESDNETIEQLEKIEPLDPNIRGLPDVTDDD